MQRKQREKELASEVEGEVKTEDMDTSDKGKAAEVEADEEEEVDIMDMVPNLNKRHFEQAMVGARKSVSPQDIHKYRMFAETLVSYTAHLHLFLFHLLSSCSSSYSYSYSNSSSSSLPLPLPRYLQPPASIHHEEYVNTTRLCVLNSSTSVSL